MNQFADLKLKLPLNKTGRKQEKSNQTLDFFVSRVRKHCPNV